MKLAVIGLGYISLPPCVAQARKFEAVRFDIDKPCGAVIIGNKAYGKGIPTVG